jgi:hypothetical protein
LAHLLNYLFLFGLDFDYGTLVLPHGTRRRNGVAGLSHGAEISRQSTLIFENDGRGGATKGEAILNAPTTEVNLKVVKSLA